MTVVLMVGLVAVAGAIALGWAAFATESPHAVASRRLASIEEYYARDTGRAPEQVAGRGQPLVGPLGGLRSLGVRLSPASARARLQHRLDVAGNPGRWTVERTFAFKGLGLVLGTALGILLALRSPGFTVLVPVLAAAGLWLPDVLIHNAGIKRQEKVQQALPDALDMMCVCVEAGLGFDAALAQVAVNTEGALAAECARVLQEMQFGKSRPQALRAMSERTTVAELRVLVAALVQASELGIAVATVLREQAGEMRKRRRQRAEEKAQKVTVKVLFPLIFCLFPALLIIVIGPGALGIATLFP